MQIMAETILLVAGLAFGSLSVGYGIASPEVLGVPEKAQ
jgi:hypothetical protein